MRLHACIFLEDSTHLRLPRRYGIDDYPDPQSRVGVPASTKAWTSRALLLASNRACELSGLRRRRRRDIPQSGKGVVDSISKPKHSIERMRPSIVSEAVDRPRTQGFPTGQFPNILGPGNEVWLRLVGRGTQT